MDKNKNSYSNMYNYSQKYLPKLYLFSGLLLSKIKEGKNCPINHIIPQSYVESSNF